ncbi:hypothetical protein SASPL_150527 [Salvia splendens]|uniref:Uncharacterized protein n=1 Tax=Salvia splendens TaxID=180675 RepID=A0A8X8Z2J1_SALSN|nr:hypothetical protein SASPL_150527 [Salvia splendens]
MLPGRGRASPFDAHSKFYYRELTVVISVQPSTTVIYSAAIASDAVPTIAVVTLFPSDLAILSLLDDGKVMELKSAVFVNELLLNFEGVGVTQSRKCGKFLAPSFELQLGKTFYLFPWKLSVAAADGGSTEGATKRIKIVITKKQPEELLSNQTSWKPGLLPIPEENEL